MPSDVGGKLIYTALTEVPLPFEREIVSRDEERLTTVQQKKRYSSTDRTAVQSFD